jgi:hypothetical protein
VRINSAMRKPVLPSMAVMQMFRDILRFGVQTSECDVQLVACSDFEAGEGHYIPEPLARPFLFVTLFAFQVTQCSSFNRN